MLTVSADDLQQTFGFRAPAGYKPRYNIAPSQQLIALTSEAEAPVREMMWGLVPAGSPDASWSRRMINARSESVATKASFRQSFEVRRCLVVLDGYYEWQTTTGSRRPHRICLKSRKPFTVAAIWDRWEGGEVPLESCAIITTAASRATAGIHDRMPGMIPPELRRTWLDLNASKAELAKVMIPFEADELDVYEVSTLVNNPANDSPDCIEPFTGAPSNPPLPSGRGRRKAVSSEILDLFLPSEVDS